MRESSRPYIGWVPHDWKDVRLKHVLRAPVTDGPHETPVFVDDGFPFLSVDGIQNGEIVFEGCRFISERNFLEYRRKASPELGDLLMGKAASTGKIARVRTTQAFAIWSPLALLKFDESTVDSRFLEYVLKTPALQQQIDDLCNANTQKNIGMGDIPKLAFALPTLQEQLRIANFLDDKTARIDALIAEKEQLILKLEEYWKSKAAEMVLRGLHSDVQTVETGIPWLGEIPSHWQLVPLKSLFRLVAEAAPDNHGLQLLSLYTSIGVRPRSELEARGNKASSTDGYWLVRENDLVVNKLLAWMGAIAGSAYSGVTSPAYDILRPSLTVNTWYFDALFRSDIYLPEFKSKSRGIMEMRLRLYWDQLGTVKVPCPPKMEQDEIVAELKERKSRVDVLLDHCNQHIARLREYRSSLISAAVTGQLDISQ